MTERRIQSDLTLVLDHEKILSASAKAEIERASQRMLAAESPDDDEAEAILERERGEAADRPTLQPCPACKDCEFCCGQHMVTPERASSFPPPKEES